MVRLLVGDEAREGVNENRDQSTHRMHQLSTIVERCGRVLIELFDVFERSDHVEAKREFIAAPLRLTRLNVQFHFGW